MKHKHYECIVAWAGDTAFGTLVYREFEPDLEKWDLKITYQDGIVIKAEVAE